MATIYKIYCRDNKITDCYVGSTEAYNKRYNKHNSSCNNTNDPKYNYKVYKFIRANGGMDNFIIEQIIDCNVEDRYDAELYYFKLFKATLNTIYPKRSDKQYWIDNRQKISEQRKQYRENNKQTITEQQKQYYENNKETILEKTKQYRENNKEKRKIKIECECGSLVRKSDISKHRKSIKHQNYINSKL